MASAAQGNKMELNKIYLGDAYELIKTIPTKSVDLIVTDPPYQINTLTGGSNRIGNDIMKITSELGKNSLNVGVDLTILDEFMRVMKKPNIYIWMNLKQLAPYIDYFVNKHKCNWNLIVWNKPNAMPLCGSKYLNDCEYCAYFYKGIKLNTRFKTAKTVYVLPINVADKQKYGHPTIKPLEIMENIIYNSSNENEIVLDPFIGSGTTAVACKHLKRKFIGFEISEEYHKIATKRIQGIDKKGRMNLFDLEDSFADCEQITLFDVKKGE